MSTTNPIDPDSPDLAIAIVGAGVMGRGIAQIAAQAGVRTLLFDARDGAAQAAKDFVLQQYARLAEKGRMTADAVAAATAKLEVAKDIAALAPARVVIEAIVEDLAVKRALFKDLEAVIAPDALIATNTSSLPVTAIAAACKHAGRVGGFHFFNPVPLMKVIEVIDGALTEPWVGEALVRLAKRFGHRPVRAQDTPGFIVNHASRGYSTESLRLMGEGVATSWQVDRVMRDAAGFRMGPLELLDLTGLDVSHPVMESIYHQYYEEARYRPSVITAQRATAGLLGRKTGRGFYRYDNGQQETIPDPAVPQARPARVWVSNRDFGPKLKALLHKLGAPMDTADRPGPESLILVAPLGRDATTCATEEKLDPARTLAVDCLLPMDKRRVLMGNPLTLPAMRDAAHGVLASDGVPVTVIHDSPGFIAQRVLAMVVNIGCDIAQQRIATPSDIEAAVTLGLGYPHGPLSWGDAIGADKLLAVLNALHAFYGDPRYRPSPWLKRRAMLGVSLLTEEG
jgi:3-hydroxybutyryl-CoA dehydrogenase